MFLNAKIKHLPYSFFDHCQLLINTDRENNEWKVNRFWFEAWWTFEVSFEEEVKRILGSTLGNILDKLSCVCKGLKVWAKKVKMERTGLKCQLTKKLETLMDNEKDDDNIAKLIDTKVI
ncbi:hypothetical protein J1N35_005813 [Gossypium stocksii]|uniref:Uncharacterized protein n=1 Tax=Gossypium stocksii TaxID=47602 RepID=A0A9D3WF59_9ROSI|nr:hypothetical protein J1N35_005813 [Gossypium stocksii]